MNFSFIYNNPIVLCQHNNNLVITATKKQLMAGEINNSLLC